MDAEMVAKCLSSDVDIFAYDSEEDNGNVIFKTPLRVTEESTPPTALSSTLPSNQEMYLLIGM